MLKKISVDQVRLGMHLHALEGAWIDHPFWKTRFVIADMADLRKLSSSNVREVWIDPTKGLDVAVAYAPDDVAKVPPVLPAAVAAATQPHSLATASAPPPAAQGPHRQSMADELHEAAAICGRGKQAVMSMFKEARLGHAVDAEGCLPLVEEISSSVLRNPGAMVSLARLKTQDEYSYMHSVAVCALMVALGREVGMGEDECRSAGLAGLMHDLGKAVMPLDVLNKPGKLTEEEFTVMRSHPERGHALLLEGRGASAEVLDVCLHHHERVDGTGYPHKLSGDAISRIAKMGAICDVYDAITSNRPYKQGWDPAESIARMASWKGHFDPDLFRSFVKSLGIYPVGSLVRLESGRLAVVTEQNPTALTAPQVRIFFSAKSNMPVPTLKLDLSTGADRIVGRESAATWGFKQLDALWTEGAAPRRT
jgi:HD-GYP domain-containing protein (c-di-GMP phosphodiesterase class II)